MATNRRLAAPRAVATYLEGVLAERWPKLTRAFGTSAVVSARRLGLIGPLLPGIYVVTGTESDTTVRAVAATIWAAPAGLVTGLAAAHLWRIVDEPPDRITVQLPYSWHLKGPHWVRPLRIDTPQRRFRKSGIAMVSAPDAVVQSWREARPDVGAATVIAAVRLKATTASDLLEALSGRRQMPRRAELTELIGLAGNEVTSYLEYIAWRDVFPPDQFPHLQWQLELWPNGRRRVLDAFDAEAMIDLEFDGGGTHGGTEGFERDRERDNDMRAAGIEPLHFTYRDLTQRPEWCRQTYRRMRAERLQQRGMRVS